MLGVKLQVLAKRVLLLCFIKKTSRMEQVAGEATIKQMDNSYVLTNYQVSQLAFLHPLQHVSLYTRHNI
jgi:hypothetical protein